MVCKDGCFVSFEFPGEIEAGRDDAHAFFGALVGEHEFAKIDGTHGPDAFVAPCTCEALEALDGAKFADDLSTVTGVDDSKFPRHAEASEKVDKLL